MRFKTRSAGFSLIEMAIGLLIVGLITGPMMMEYAAWKNSQKRDLTFGNELKIENALTKYAQNNGCYPLPARPGILNTNVAFGAEAVRPSTDPPCRDITAGELTAIPACAGDDTVVCKTTCVPNATTCLTPIDIIIGDVPFATLGLPKQYIIDGFKRKFSYAVSANLLQSSTFDNNAGIVRVQDLLNAGPVNGAGPVIANAHYALVSHGRDGVGAFTYEGGTIVVACTGGTGVDIDNCNNNGNFNNGFGTYTKVQSGIASTQYDRIETNVAGAGHFDDFVLYSTTISSDIWAKNNSSDIVSNTGNAGNVLIKLSSTPPGASNPQARLDIRGDLSADGLWATYICDTSANSYTSPTYSNQKCVFDNGVSNNAFDPSWLGGTPSKTGQQPGAGIHCGAGMVASLPAGTGVPMAGIAQADEQCPSTDSLSVVDSVGAAMTLAGCPGGQLPYGVLGGALRCWPSGTPP